MKKILFIGNSFSEDATRYIEAVAGGELFVRNLMIGGCSLERHASNIKENLSAYAFEKDAEPLHSISVRDALLLEKWDCVSIQQVSYESGRIETYEPHIKTVIDEIHEYAPSARIVFHRTWAYECGSIHPNFDIYAQDTAKMNEMIEATARRISEKYSLPVIPTGNAVYAAYNTPEFDILRGGCSITRDTYHLSLTYGRYLAALVVYRFFTGYSATRVKFFPDGCDEKLINLLKKIADGVQISRPI